MMIEYLGAFSLCASVFRIFFFVREVGGQFLIKNSNLDLKISRAFRELLIHCWSCEDT